MTMKAHVSMTRWLEILLFCLLWAALATPARAELALERVESSRRGADQLEITLTLSGPAPQPGVFTTRVPSRIALDLPQVVNHTAQRTHPVGVGLTQAVQVVEAGGRTRVVIELTDLPQYQLKVDGNRILVTLDNHVIPAALAAPQQGGSAVAATGHGIQSLDFRRGEQGEGRLVIQLNDPKTGMDMTQRGEDTVVTLSRAQLPESLRQRLDVQDFATPVHTIEARQVGADAVLTIRAAPDAEAMAYQTDGVLTVAFRPPARRDQPGSAMGRFGGGQPVTLNFQNVETRALLQILADVSGKNIVLSDSIGGTLALRLQNVPWDQALEIIMQSRGLALREVGDTLMVAPATEIAAFQDQQRKTEQAAPMRSEFIQINYAKAKDLAALLKSEGRNLLSPQGQVSVDERTNTLLVMETGSRLADIRALVTKLDVAVAQVLIEARIVVASDDFSRDLGARFGFSGVDSFDKQRGLNVTSGTMGSTDTSVAASLDSSATNGTVFPTKIPTGTAGYPQRLNVNLPAVPASGIPASIALAVLGRDFLVDLELSALQAEGKGEILSNPRVLTANQKTASIRQGVEIPYQTNGGTTTAPTISFKEAVLSLEVTPQITPDNRVIMDLKVTRDNVGKLVPNGTGGSIPSIDKRELNTQVLVSNGETIVLGGVYEEESNNSVTKVPLLGDIPFLGALFREKSKSSTKRELLIFITPKIVHEGLALTP
jgi:type IV pilus assembly protein PilQ